MPPLQREIATGSQTPIRMVAAQQTADVTDLIVESNETPVPPQRKKAQHYDFRHAATAPHGVKRLGKRKLEECAEQARIRPAGTGAQCGPGSNDCSCFACNWLEKPAAPASGRMSSAHPLAASLGLLHAHRWPLTKLRLPCGTMTPHRKFQSKKQN